MNRLDKFIGLFLWCVIIFPHFSHAQDNIISFYPKAYAKTQNPPEEKKLIIIAEQKIEDKYVTFIGVEKGKVLLVVLTEDKKKNPQKSIRLKLQITSKEIEFKGHTMTFYNVPDVGEIQDWGYVFDRNGDGKFDYVTFLVGAIPVKQKDFPADFPTDNPLVPYQKDPKHLDIYKRSCQLVFNHFADDNYDGNVDAVVLERMDSERSWVDNWIVIQRSKFKETVDTCWLFKNVIGVKQGDCVKTQKGFMVRRAAKDSTVFDTEEKVRAAKILQLYETKYIEFGNADMAKISELLSLLNQAANLCGLSKDSFYKE